MSLCEEEGAANFYGHIHRVCSGELGITLPKLEYSLHRVNRPGEYRSTDLQVSHGNHQFEHGHTCESSVEVLT